MQIRNVPDEVFNRRIRRFESACRDNGLKMTHQRMVIFKDLARSTDHPSAEMVHGRVRRDIPTISLDTVYRTLTTFEKCGLIFRVQAEAGQARYDAGLEPHHHFVCTRCKTIYDFVWDEFEKVALPEVAGSIGRVLEKQAVLKGICHQCLAQENVQKAH
jgi:Fur family peroxide stress response transcriptional regulator